MESKSILSIFVRNNYAADWALQHEHGSVMMLRYLIEKNGLMDEMKKYNLTQTDVSFIEELIVADKSLDVKHVSHSLQHLLVQKPWPSLLVAIVEYHFWVHQYVVIKIIAGILT